MMTLMAHYDYEHHMAGMPASHEHHMTLMALILPATTRVRTTRNRSARAGRHTVRAAAPDPRARDPARHHARPAADHPGPGRTDPPGRPSARPFLTHSSFSTKKPFPRQRPSPT